MRLAIAIIASAALVLASPYIGQLRSALRQAFPGDFVLIVAVAIALSISFAMAAAIRRIRERRALRYGALAAALGIGAGYAMLSRTGIPEVDVVERVHFVEYGLITLLFYRAWRSSGDAAALILPAIASLIVGTCEEWLQWFIPARVGELRDVFLNLWAIVCGLLFSIGLDPPERLTLRLSRASMWRVRRAAAILVAVIGAFIYTVHLGYRIDDPNTGAFRSRYDASELAALASDRAARWRTQPPLTWSRLSREDQYMTEGVQHVRRRNEAWQEGDAVAAWHENLILERYFAPVLDTPSYVSATGHRWPAEQRAEAERRYAAASRMGAYVSEADETPVFVWSKFMFWMVGGLLLVGLVMPGLKQNLGT